MAKTTLFYYARTDDVNDATFLTMGNAAHAIVGNSSEAPEQAIIGAAGTLSDLWARVAAGGVSRAVTVRVETTDTSITVAPTGAGEFTDNTNTASISANDKICFGITGGTLTPEYFSCVFDATSDTVFLLNVIDHNGRAVVGTDWYFANTTLGPSNSALANAHLLRSAGTITRAYCFINTSTGTATFKVALNGTVTAQAITTTSSTTGLFEFTGSAVSFSAGDTIQWEVVETAGATNFISFGVTCVSTTSKQDCLGIMAGNRTASATVNFWPIAGREVATNTNEARVKHSMQYAGTASNLRIHAPSNSYTGNATFTLRKNGVDTAVTLSHTAASTSLIEDTTNSVTFSAGDDLSLSYTGGTSGTLGLNTTWALTLEADVGDDELLADNLATGTPTLGTPAIGQVHALLADNLATGAPTLSSPALDLVALLADNLATPAPTLGNPALGQEHALLADDLATPAPTLSTPAIGVVHNLLADNLATPAPTLDQGVIGQEHALLADDLATPAPTLDQGVLGQEHVLLADDLATPAPTLSTPQIKQTLLADNLATGTPTLSSPAIGQIHVFTATDLSTPAPTLDQGVLGQEHVLLADNLATGTPILEQGLFVTISDLRLLVLASERRVETLKAEQRITILPEEQRVIKP